jgi:uridine kinase
VLVAITGGSGSGKSTLAKALQDALPRGTAALMSEDWYYHDVEVRPGFDPADHDFDDVSARDHALLIEHLQTLKTGHAVVAPDYCFVRHARRPGGVAIPAAPVVIVEGSHLLCAEDLVAFFDLRVFLDTPSDVRFIRRLTRDQRERGRTVDSVVRQYLKTVRPAHERLTDPSRAHADLVLLDLSAAIEHPEPDVVAALAAPVLAHPLLERFAQE